MIEYFDLLYHIYLFKNIFMSTKNGHPIQLIIIKLMGSSCDLKEYRDTQFLSWIGHSKDDSKHGNMAYNHVHEMNTDLD